MRNLVAFLAMGLFFSVSCFAQSVTVMGKVFSGEDGEPLWGATIYLPRNHTGARADSTGSFSLEARYGDRILIDFIGYSQQYYDVKEDSYAEFYLQPDSFCTGDKFMLPNNLSFSGTIRDAETGKLLEGVSVTARKPPFIVHRPDVTTLTNPDGYFLLHANSQDSVRLSYPGYKEQLFPITMEYREYHLVKIPPRER